MATVSKKGIITAKSKGYAKITITSADKAVSKTYRIKVVDKSKVNKILQLKKSSLNIKKTKSYQIRYKKITSGTTDKFTFKTSNNKIATISNSGMIQAKKKGMVTITVSCGLKKAKIKVTVK